MLQDIIQYARINKIPIMKDDSILELKKYIRKIKPETILEIGTAIGYSGIIMLEECSQNAKLTTIELDEDRANIAKENFNKAKVSGRVRQIIGDANEIIPCITEKYDFILLDGPKGHYSEMLPYLIELLNNSGMLFADDVLYLGLVEGDKDVLHKHRTIVNNMRNFIDLITNDKRLKTQLIKVDNGIIIATKRN